MMQLSNNIIFLYELVESYSLAEIKKNMGALFEVFLEAGFLTVRNSQVTFSYIGIAADSTNVICILPKYLKGNLDSPEQFLLKAKQLIKVLKAYQKNVNQNVLGQELTDYSSASVNSEISLADSLLIDYLQNGLWESSQKIIVNDSDNEILWDLTVEKSTPVISGNPHYFELYSLKSEVVTETLIAQIHTWAVSYCTRKYAALLDIDSDFDIWSVSELEDLGEKNYLLSTLERELRVTFDDRRITLLKTLAELINVSGEYGESVYTLYGKNKFEHIWEAAVGYCFRNEYSKYKNYISVPKWVNMDGSIVSEKRTLKPDVIKWILKDGKSYLLIVDAKYYLYRFDDINQKVDNNPGVGDVVKQYFYEFVLSRMTSSAEWLNHDTKYLNVLVFPKQDVTGTTFDISGSVSLDNVVTNKPIVNVYVNPDIIFNKYIEEQAFSDSEVLDFASEISSFQ